MASAKATLLEKPWQIVRNVASLNGEAVWWCQHSYKSKVYYHKVFYKREIRYTSDVDHGVYTTVAAVNVDYTDDTLVIVAIIMVIVMLGTLPMLLCVAFKS